MKMNRKVVIVAVASAVLCGLVAAKVYAVSHRSCDAGWQMSVTKSPALVICMRGVTLSGPRVPAIDKSGN